MLPSMLHVSMLHVTQYVACYPVCYMLPSMLHVTQYVTCYQVCYMLPSMLHVTQYVACTQYAACAQGKSQVPSMWHTIPSMSGTQYVACTQVCGMYPHYVACTPVRCMYPTVLHVPSMLHVTQCCQCPGKMASQSAQYDAYYALHATYPVCAVQT